MEDNGANYPRHYVEKSSENRVVSKVNTSYFLVKGFSPATRAKYMHFAQLQVYRSWNKADKSKTLDLTHIIPKAKLLTESSES